MALIRSRIIGLASWNLVQNLLYGIYEINSLFPACMLDDHPRSEAGKTGIRNQPSRDISCLLLDLTICPWARYDNDWTHVSKLSSKSLYNLWFTLCLEPATLLSRPKDDRFIGFVISRHV